MELQEAVVCSQRKQRRGSGADSGGISLTACVLVVIEIQCIHNTDSLPAIKIVPVPYNGIKFFRISGWLAQATMTSRCFVTQMDLKATSL